jgi:hypothetical protein
LPATPAQSAAATHCWQRPVLVLHFVPPGFVVQFASLVQPGRHWLSMALQTGVSPEQSAFARHWTHWNTAGSHFGCVAGQSVFVRQATQVLKSVWQSGRPVAAGQSAFVVHPTQAPVVWSH